MLAKIKSIYFTKIVFSYLYERKKFQIIKYNKSLQNLFEINLVHYIFFSGKYIIYESKNFGKEFGNHDNNLIYEGEYLHGERNGKGKEFFSNGKIKYEGEYSHGIRNGKGKEYFIKGKIKFEGEYLRGKKWNGKEYSYINGQFSEFKNGTGFIKEYDAFYGNLLFEGEYLNGEKNGKGKKYYNDFDNHRLKFEGEYLKGKKWNGIGYGKSAFQKILYTLNDGKGAIKEYDYKGELVFEGEFINGKINGYVNENRKNNLAFNGEYLNGKKWKGKIRIFNYVSSYFLYQRKDKFKEFIGEYLNGKINGKAKEYFDEKLIFEGEYLYGWKRKGKEYINGKLEYEGEYMIQKKWTGKTYDEKLNVIYEINNGTGKIRQYNDELKIIFEGEFFKGKRKGKGVEYDSYGRIIFEGEYLNDKRNGKGVEYEPYGKILFEGEYLNYINIIHGIGKRNAQTEKDSIGSIKFEGEYFEGKRWNGKGEEYFNELLKYKGEYLNGQKWNGIGKKYYDHGSLKYEIEYINGKKMVKEFSMNEELLFCGEYLKDKRNGNGKEYYKNELIFEGEFSNGNRWNGKGSEYFNNGKLKYKGEYLNGKNWNGKGYDFEGNEVYEIINGKGNIKEYDGNGNLKYESQYLNGEKNGKGKEYYYWNGKIKYEGEYLNGMKSGKGKEYDVKGNLIFEGEYLNDERIEKKS